MYKILIHSYSSTNWNKEIRNGGVSTDCSGGSDDHKIVFGLNCTTFGCELNRTDASRIATTVPLNITQLLEKFKGISTNNSSAENASNYSVPVQGNQSNATVFNICYPELNINPTSVTPMDVTPMDRTAPPTSSIDSSLAEELESAILIVLKIVSTLRNLHVFHCLPALDK